MTMDRHEGSFGNGDGDERLAADVSDYVSGRLDPLAELEFVRRAAGDRKIAAAVKQAHAVRRRIALRWSVGGRDGTEPSSRAF